MSSNLWGTVKLKDVTRKIGSGATPKGGSQVYLEEGIAFIRSQNVYNNYFDYSGLVHINDQAADRLKNVTLEKDDVLLNITGDSVARCTIVPQEVLPARVNQHVAIIRADKDVLDFRYLKYALVNNSAQQKLLSYAQSGGTRAALTKSMIENFEILLPKITEQKEIANVLSLLDEKIQLNTETTQTLEEMAQTLFKRWFVDFEFPNEIGEPYKSSGGEMVESELGMIPKGWEVKALNDISVLNMGVSPTSDSYNEKNEGLPLINGASDFEGKNIKPTKYTTSPKKTCLVDDMVFGVRATIGNTVFSDGEYAIGRGVAALRPKNNIDKEFIYFILENSMTRLINSASGSVFLNLKKSDILNIQFAYNSNIIANIHNVLKPIITIIIDNDRESKDLKELRDTLLPKLMSGEIRVSDLEVLED